MAQVTLNIRDDLLPDILDAFEARFGNRPAGETKPQFFKRMLKDYIKNVMLRYKEETAIRINVPDPGDIEA